MKRAFAFGFQLAFVLITSADAVQAQTPDTTADYFPLRIGNTWTYHQFILGRSDTTSLTFSILGTTIRDSTIYYEHNILDWAYPIRKDSLGRVWQYRERDSIEVLAFDFTLAPGDVYEALSLFHSGSYTVIVGEEDVETAVGRFENARTFDFCPMCVDGGEVYAFVLGVGLVSHSRDHIWGIRETVLTDAPVLTNTNFFAEQKARQWPSRPVLRAVYPNPFSEQLFLSVDLRASTYGPSVDVIVYDMLGRRVRTLASGFLSPGLFDLTWDGTDEAGRHVAGGIYFVRLQVGARSQGVQVVYVR